MHDPLNDWYADAELNDVALSPIIHTDQSYVDQHLYR